MPRPAWERTNPGRWVLLCTLAALILRLFRIGHQSFHIDEIISIEAATHATGAAFWRALLHDIHGPLTSALLHGWVRLGEGETWLRLLYLVPGVLAVPVVYRLGRELLDEATGRVACLALALSPFQVWYGQEVRNYSWLVFFLMVALLLFARIWNGHAGRGTWAGLTVVLALSVVTNYSTLFLLIALTLAVLARRERGMLLRWSVTLVVVGAVFLPWFLDWYHRIDAGRLFVDRPSPLGVPLRKAEGLPPAALPYMFWAFSFGYSLGPSLQALHLDRSVSSLLRHSPVLLAGALSIGTALLLGVRQAARARRATLLALLVLVPVALAVLLTVRDIKAFNARYVMVAWPPFLLLLAAGWRQPGPLPRTSALVAAALALLSLGNHYFDPRYAKEDMRSAAAIVRQHGRPGDTILVIDNNKPFRYYYAQRYGGELPVAHLHKRFLRTEDELADHVRDAAAPDGRTWLVLSRWWEVAPRATIYRIVDETLVREESWDLPGVELSVWLHRGRPGEP